MSFYPKPSEAGGVLIRKVMSLSKSQGLTLPLRDPVLIAVSGGVDSMVLAHLLARYGRNFVDPANITLLHFDHGWRPESAGVEREAVERLARSTGVSFLHRKLPPPETGASLARETHREDDARKKRLQVYDELAGDGLLYRQVLTAHHQDDVAETLFWRFLRGEFDSGRDGILFRDCQCLRPFLHVKKEEIRAYAAQEGVEHHEDPTNSDPRHFRAWMREQVFPLLESGFPAVREILAGYARRPKSVAFSSEREGLQNLLAAVTRGPLNRPQREALARMLESTSEGATLFLSGGVQLKRLRRGWLIENPDREF